MLAVVLEFLVLVSLSEMRLHFLPPVCVCAWEEEGFVCDKQQQVNFTVTTTGAYEPPSL